MQHFRSSLTRLKGLLEQKLPDSADIYGYPGVSKQLLLPAVDAAYNLSQSIKDEDESRFEIISLKRTGSTLYKKLKDFLETDIQEAERQSRFNDFLDDLSALIEKTKITYYIVAKNGVRNDEELAEIRATIGNLTVLSDELKGQKDKVDSEIGTLSTAVESISANHKATDQMATEMKQWHAASAKQYTEIEKTHAAIEGWDEGIKQYNSDYQSLSKQIAELAEAAGKSRDKLNSDALAGAKQVEDMTQAAGEHRQLLDEIRQTLAGANRVGMASSFETRKRELGRQQLTWQLVFIGAVGLIILAVWKFVLPTIAADTRDWSKLIAELGMVFPLIWLGWFAAKQYGYTSKIREDYAFKCAAAMAYEGHKKAAREVDEELERILLEFSLYNMAQNPIRLFGTGDIHGTPLHEIIDQVLRRFPKLNRISGEVPSLGKFDVSGGKEEQDKTK